MLRKILGKSTSQTRIIALTKWIAKMPNGWGWAAEVEDARVGVETFEAYGLEITLDANGNAQRLVSLRGAFEVVAE